MGQYTGMALEERLEKADLLEQYEAAVKDRDIEKVIKILKQVEVHPQNARLAAESVL